MIAPQLPPNLYVGRQPLELANPIAQGREGTVYPHPRDRTQAVKILRTDHPDLETAGPKITLLASAPIPSPATRNYLIAWPLATVTTSSRKGRGRVAGYTMRLLDTTRYRHIGAYLNPARRRRQIAARSAPYTYLHLVIMARNLAAAAAALHRHGILIGDLNSRNVLASDRARVAIIDADSFQTTDPLSGRIFRCPVGTPEYTPPRLQGLDFAQVDRTPEDDDFALAVMIYQLLFQGSHPFAGTSTPDPNQASIAQRIAHSLFAHAKGAAATPHSALIWKDTPLKKPFTAAFNGRTPPTALSWQAILTEAASKLRRCPRSEAHWHFTARCTWCRYQQSTRLDPFPSTSSPPPKVRKSSRQSRKSR